MKNLKKRMLAACAAMGILFAGQALAAKVSYIEETGDTAYHLAHLLSHEEGTVCTSTTDLFKVRVAPNSNKLHGRMMQGEKFVIIDSYKEWLRIEIVSSTPENPDSRRGMTGWVTVDYIDCGCDEEAYYASAAQKTEN